MPHKFYSSTLDERYIIIITYIVLLSMFMR